MGNSFPTPSLYISMNSIYHAFSHIFAQQQEKKPTHHHFTSFQRFHLQKNEETKESKYDRVDRAEQAVR
jgi:hypothetical protein